MPRRILQIGSALLSPLLLAPALLAMTLATGSSVFAKPGAQREQQREAQLARQRAAPNANNPKPGERRMLAMPPAWVQQLRQMTPQQQERFFNNNERFRELPPQRQAQIRQQMQQWNRLSPDQRQTMLNRQQVWDRLTPQQQGYVRETLLPQWQRTPPVQRQAILGKLRQLRGLDDVQRTARLNDESFLGGLNPQDRQMLRDLSNLRVGPEEAGGPPAEP